MAWERYADLALWPRWAPMIRDVVAAGTRLGPGLRGTVHGPAGVRIGFEVEAFDEPRRWWSWRVRSGPLALRLEHEVLERPAGGCVATLRLEGPWPVVTAYAPVAALALQRLVSRRL